MDYGPWLLTDPTPADLDLSIVEVIPVQVIENVDLVKNKPTAIKVVVEKQGSDAADNISVQIEHNGSKCEVFYVDDKENRTGTGGGLQESNGVYPLNFGTDVGQKTIYFVADELKPTGSSFEVTATVDHKEEFIESNEGNNAETSLTAEVFDEMWSGSRNPNLQTPGRRWKSDPCSWHLSRNRHGNTGQLVYD